MRSRVSKKIPQSPLYQKAIDIFTLSRCISNYYIDDLNKLDKSGKENTMIYFTGDIIQQSVSLAPEILKAENELFSEEKYKYIVSITRLSNLLYKSCERLERTHSNGKDFLPILRNELRKFRKMQRVWMMSL